MGKTKDMVDEISTEELEQILAKRRAEQQQQYEAKKQEYETLKTALINAIGARSCELAGEIREHKRHTMETLQRFREQMLEYGDVRGGEKNKGNFTIKNEFFKITFSSQTKKEFDERAELAETHLKQFLNGFVKKRDKGLYELIMGLLERNHTTGALDIDNINRLYKLEDKFEDADWKKAIELFKEAYNPTSTSRYVDIERATQEGGWEKVNLNFSSAKL